MRAWFLGAGVLLLGISPPLQADEADDQLAQRMAAIVRDFRQPLATRVEAVRTLEKLGPRAAVAVNDLVTVLNRLRGSEQEPLQEAIVEALGRMGTKAKVALPALARAVHRTADLDLAIHNSTAAILAASDSQDIEALTFQLTSRDASLRLRAAKALGDLGAVARTAIPALTQVLKDTDHDVRRAAIAAIRAIEPNAVPSEALIRAIAEDLRDPDPNRRLIAARTLGQIGPAAAIVAPALEALRADPDADVRRAAAAAFARVTAPPPPLP
ncbi:MAG: HEAT repeat domain-containing protein [Gemmataceae bacterium]|nr:HEAT repeat domain-containing protein [Gemmata sp.]MDW8199406.1 HEAT repeat domain-containing protein [Gemmataceae bacterium]